MSKTKLFLLAFLSNAMSAAIVFLGIGGASIIAG
jgi:hypothetical protein